MRKKIVIYRVIVGFAGISLTGVGFPWRRIRESGGEPGRRFKLSQSGA